MKISVFIDMLTWRYKVEKWNEKKEKWEEIERALSYYNAKCYIDNLNKNKIKGVYRIIKNIRFEII